MWGNGFGGMMGVFGFGGMWLIACVVIAGIALLAVTVVQRSSQLRDNRKKLSPTPAFSSGVAPENCCARGEVATPAPSTSAQDLHGL